MDPIMMGILLVVLALVLVGAFLFAWKRDQSRSHAVADTESRLDVRPDGRRRSR